MPRYSVPSYDELPKGGDRVILLGGEDYLLKIIEAKVEKKLPYGSVAGDPMVDKLVIKMEAVSFADGVPLEDSKNQQVEPDAKVWFWQDVDQAHLGFMKSGTASKGRQILLAANGITDMNERIPDGDSDDLLGQVVIGSVIVGPDGKNKITGYRANVSRRRGQSAPAAPAAQRAEKPRNTTLADAAEALIAAENSDGPVDAAALASVSAFFDSDDV